jgi:hypothetical protein
MTDLQGKRIMTSENIHDGMAIDMSKLPQGFYLVKIYCNGPVKTNETVKIFKGN